MRKSPLILSALFLAVLNSGARAATADAETWVAAPLFVPQPAEVAVFTLICMGVILLVSRRFPSGPFGAA